MPSFLRGVSDSLGMVAGARANHAALEFFRLEAQHFIERTANLKAASGLLILEFENDIGAEPV